MAISNTLVRGCLPMHPDDNSVYSVYTGNLEDNDMIGGAPLAGAAVATRETLPTKGTAVVSADGKFEYTPNPGSSGDDYFKYRITYNGQTTTALVTITVPPLGFMNVTWQATLIRSCAAVAFAFLGHAICPSICSAARLLAPTSRPIDCPGE